MPTVREYEAAMERNAADTEAFVALRKAYRQAQKHDRLVTLYEARAQAIEDNAKAGELFYLAAELRIDQLGDAEGAEADLVNAVDRDPSHIRAAARLKDIYREQGRTADYMTMLEMEAAAVARTRDPARIAELEAEMSQLFLNHFARLERAVRNPQRAGAKLAQEHVRSIESARKIYRALGDFRAVVRLYELELEGTQDARRRADLLLGLGRVLGEKLEELDAAAQRLPEVVRLRPRDEKALELLAGFYANPNWIGADGADRAAAIYFQLARRRQEASDVENAIAALRRALAAVPGHAESSELLERVYYDARRFQELDRFYRERVQTAATEAERIDFLYKRAQLSEGELEDVAEAQRVYNEISLLEPAGGPASEKLVELYLHGQEYAKLAELRERQLGAIADPQQRARDDAGAGRAVPRPAGRSRPGGGLPARGAGDRARESDGAGRLRRALPREGRLGGAGRFAGVLVRARAAGGHRRRGAVAAAGGDRHRQREAAGRPRARDRGLAACRGDRADVTAGRARRSGACCSRARAGTAWPPCWNARPPRRRIRRSAPRSCAAPPRSTARSWARPRARSRSTRTSSRPIRRTRCRCARSSRPTSARATSSAWPTLLREQIDRAGTKQERVGLLRRVLVICDERTGDLAQGQWAANEILQAVPGDRDTLTRLERILERAGQPAELVQRARSAHQARREPGREAGRSCAASPTSCAARCRIRPARRQRLEEVVRLDPDDGKALGTLVEIYAALNRYEDLARILDLQVERVVADPAQQAEYLRQLARLVEGQLRELGRARHTWEQLLDLLPDRHARRWPRWRASSTARPTGSPLVRIMERQMPLAEDPAAPPTSACSAPRSSTRSCTTPTRPRWRWSSWSPRSIRATSSPTSACAATTRPTRTGRASSRSPSGSCS